jgi:hypothetical protein
MRGISTEGHGGALGGELGSTASLQRGLRLERLSRRRRRCAPEPAQWPDDRRWHGGWGGLSTDEEGTQRTAPPPHVAHRRHSVADAGSSSIRGEEHPRQGNGEKCE